MDWAESVAAEEARAEFIRRYRELRPLATLQRLGVYESLQLALRAMAFMWAQSRGWERIAETFLVLAFERLNSRLPGLSAFFRPQDSFSISFTSVNPRRTR